MKWFGPLTDQRTERAAARELLGKQKRAGRVTQKLTIFQERTTEEANRLTCAAFSHALRSRDYRRRKKLGIIWKPGGPSEKCKMALQMRRQGKLSTREIGEELGVDPSNVRRWFRKYPKGKY